MADSKNDKRDDPLRDAPPFLSWRAIYAVVLGALAVEALLGALLTALFA